MLKWRHKKNLLRDNLLVPLRSSFRGRGAEFHAFVPTTWHITKSSLPCNNGIYFEYCQASHRSGSQFRNSWRGRVSRNLNFSGLQQVVWGTWHLKTKFRPTVLSLSLRPHSKIKVSLSVCSWLHLFVRGGTAARLITIISRCQFSGQILFVRPNGTFCTSQYNFRQLFIDWHSAA